MEDILNDTIDMAVELHVLMLKQDQELIQEYKPKLEQILKQQDYDDED